MEELPEAQAEALVLHVVLDYTVDEVAVAVDVGRETVRSRLRLAKGALRQRVQGDPRLIEELAGDA